MKIAIYGKRVIDNYLPLIPVLFENLLKRKVTLLVYKPFYDFLSQQIELDKKLKTFNDDKDIYDVNYLFSIGGDGTLLDTITFVKDKDIPILGINTGRLGFLTSISTEEIDEAIDAIFARKFYLDTRTLLSLQTDNNLFGDDNYALNEITLQKKDSSSMITIHAYLGDEFLNSYWADGLIISTPTGSTAYSLSCGGPIILPSSGNIIINPIAPHNLNVCPIVIPDDIELTLKTEGRTGNFLVALDSRSYTVPFKTVLKIKKAKHTINIIRFEKNSFLNTLRTKLMWGLDKRN
ncbi:MAG: NAD kinase [Flavobacteriales bacterium CG_4_10_14_0_2_um_filter_32_8]|nr:MAG: NAD kinase [Flavobacteriales bacterium CG_4_10_14_0_2_um_filter_32_8]PJB15783.1 MAG: NAD kinase [Flavobacteriales bacterium CG_4_9_14_3_um_filter_32_8]